MPRMRWRHHDLIKPIQLNFERKITKARISTNIFPSQFLAQQHPKKLQLEGGKHNKWLRLILGSLTWRFLGIRRRLFLNRALGHRSVTRWRHFVNHILGHHIPVNQISGMALGLNKGASKRGPDFAVNRYSPCVGPDAASPKPNMNTPAIEFEDEDEFEGDFLYLVPQVSGTTRTKFSSSLA